jgi:hypothetical protein
LPNQFKSLWNYPAAICKATTAVRGVAPFYPLPAGLGKRAARRFSGWLCDIGRCVRQLTFQNGAIAARGMRANSFRKPDGVLSRQADLPIRAALEGRPSTNCLAFAISSKWFRNLPLLIGHAMLKIPKRGATWPGKTARIPAVKATPKTGSRSGGSFRRDT